MPVSCGVIRFVTATRFSLRVKSEWESRAFGDDSQRPAWLSFRADLLRKGLERSLLAQSRRPDLAYLLLDADDRPFFESRLANSIFTPLYKDRTPVVRMLLSDLKQRAWSHHVAIARIDSDDLIHDGYVASVCREILRAGTGHDQWIVCTDGIRTDLQQVQRLRYACSPFLTHYAYGLGSETVYSINHERVGERSPVRLRHPESEWIQLLTGNNVANDFWRERADFDRVDQAQADAANYLGSPLSSFDHKLAERFPSIDFEQLREIVSHYRGR